MLYENDAAWDFSDKAFLKKMFPNFTRRLDAYGSFEDWYANETTYGGKHMLISTSIAAPRSRSCIPPRRARSGPR